MPTYEYKCEECGIRFEKFQHFSEDPVRICPECEGAVRRVIQPVGIVFKGKGFYVTDNRGDSRALMPKADDSTKSDENGDKGEKAEASPATGDDSSKASGSDTSPSPAAESKTTEDAKPS